jgi:D-alanyl-D-alanine carboxypeptidase/D-alanyl-D-alanine-endopeptidase (penicillin-binding protein 4)
MNSFRRKKALWFSIVFALLTGSTAVVFGQTIKPLFQPLTVQTQSTPTPVASSTPPLVAKTGSSVAVGRKTSFPVLADYEIPGYSGVLVEDMNGNVVLDSNSGLAFNPASNVKIATAYAVIKTFGPEYRFATSVWTDGQLDAATGTLYGNLYVSGRDPVFNYEHAIAIANELNRAGVKSVNGDLIVTNNFVMNYSNSTDRAGASLAATMDAAKRSAAANRAWQSYLVNSKKYGTISNIPSVSFSGGVYVQTIPTNATLLFSHESAPVKEIIKTTLCYSNNYLAEKLGDMLGGAYAVARVVQLNAQVAPQDFLLQTSSGLGINRVTPRAMMKVLRAFRSELARYKMTFGDVMPIAGIDPGTLQHRMNSFPQTGSVVGKTGTLGSTDGGASALSGEMVTKQGKFLFVIFNQRGNNSRFRNFQDSIVTLIQNQLGGAVPMTYGAVSLDERLARTRITYPDTRARVNE